MEIHRQHPVHLGIYKKYYFFANKNWKFNLSSKNEESFLVESRNHTHLTCSQLNLSIYGYLNANLVWFRIASDAE